MTIFKQRVPGAEVELDSALHWFEANARTAASAETWLVNTNAPDDVLGDVARNLQAVGSEVCGVRRISALDAGSRIAAGFAYAGLLASATGHRGICSISPLTPEMRRYLTAPSARPL